VAHSDVNSAPTPGKGSGSVHRSIYRRPEFGALAGAIIVYVFFAIFGVNGFFTLSGTASWMNTAAELGVLAVPIGLLMISGEFDLSVGSVIGASSIIVAMCAAVFGWPLWSGVVLALVFGLCVGLMNGLVVTTTKLPSFIVTLAGLFIVAGLALGGCRYLIGTTSVSLSVTGWTADLFGSRLAGFNVSVLWWIGIVLAASWMLANTPFGNWVYASGADANAARSAGVPVARVKVILFMLSSLGAALVGILQTIQYRGGDVTYGRDFVFAAPVAAVIGGVLLTGGYGTTLGILLGTVIYGIVNLGIFYTGWNSDWAELVLGVLLLAAVVSNNYFRRLAMSGG
jgi:simple sugar transport system permease protein